MKVNASEFDFNTPGFRTKIMVEKQTGFVTEINNFQSQCMVNLPHGE
jgi:hypothetical protein